MLRGRFGESTGRPYMEGRIVIPRLGVDAHISFLVDTGADSSLISPADGYEIGIDYSKLRNLTTSIGTGGLAQSYQERASIAFVEPGRFVYVYHVDLEIAVPNPDMGEMPSLLGREILDRWRMTYDPGKRSLTFVVRSADLTLPI